MKKDLKDMTIRKEFIEKVIDTMEELQKETQTNGEDKLLCEMLIAMKENVEFYDQGEFPSFLCGPATVTAAGIF